MSRLYIDRSSLRARRGIACSLALLGSLGSLALLGCVESASDGAGDAASPRDESPRQAGPAPRAASTAPDELTPLRARATPAGDAASTSAATTGIAGASRVGLAASSEATPADRIAEGERRGERPLSETIASRATAQLRRILAADVAGDLEDVVAAEVRSDPLVPANLTETSRGERFSIARADPGAAPEPGPGAPRAGVEALLRGVRELRAGFAEGAPEVFLKPVAVRPSSQDGEIRVETEWWVRISGAAADGSAERQIRASWRCDWSLPEDTADGLSGGAPRLAELRILDFEDARFRPRGASRRRLFHDATAAVFRNVPAFADQELRGIGDWARRITRFGDMSLTGHHGLAVGDVDGDGRDDVYVCDAGSLPNRLYVQMPDGSVVDRSAAAGVDWLEDSRSALLVDLDGDGDQDLVVATIARIVIAENSGDGEFEIRGGHDGAPYPYTMAAADYDLDGDLDIFTCVYGPAEDAGGARGFEARSPVPVNDARNGGRNLLLENLGDLRFADVTRDVGLERGQPRWSFSAAWEDYDQDGDADLYVANDFGRNQLFRNDEGDDGRRRFTEVATEEGVEDVAAGMSVDWGDADRDGALDLYVGNMFSSAGSRLTGQSDFARGRSEQAISELRRMARGNSLFTRDAEGGGFRDVGAESGASVAGWAWSAPFADVNNDGWEDLVVANGYLTAFLQDDL